MTSKYNLATVAPDFSHLFSAASGGTDVLFDWQPVEIPNGTCVIKSISATVAGTNGVAGNTSDIKLYFAKSIDGNVPTTFGTVHAANTDAVTSAFRRNIIGFTFLDLSSIDDADALVSYNVLGSRGSNNLYQVETMLQGEANTTRTGFQTIYIAGEASGAAFDFGTDVDLNMAGHQAASTAAVQITTSGTDPRKVYQPGDKLIGETGTVTMEVVSVDSATTMTVKDVSAQIDHQEQLQLLNPIEFRFGLEY